MDNVELSRKIENLIRFGTVADVDHGAERCRFKSGRLETTWLRWFSVRAGETADWDPPSQGEQAILLSPSGETGAGMVIFGFASTRFPLPSHDKNTHARRFPDGALVSYNHATGALEVSGIKTATIQAAEKVTVDCPKTLFTGDVEIKGKAIVHDLLTYMNGLAGSGGSEGNNTVITGDITHEGGNLSSNGVVVHNHYHIKVVAGGDNSGGPQT